MMGRSSDGVGSSGNAIARLSEVLITDALRARTSRAPNLTSENHALHQMARNATQPPSQLMVALARMALELCEADSSGISLLERDQGEERFRWVAMAGKLADAVGGWTPREASPCGVTLARGAPQFFDRPGRIFPQLATANIVEGLVIPIATDEEAFGTIWIVTHSRSHGFDMEDVRIMESLSRFSALACLISRAHGGKGHYQVPHLRGVV
jgi:GAF domain-containing protein